jgi:hypothetical protein
MARSRMVGHRQGLTTRSGKAGDNPVKDEAVYVIEGKMEGWVDQDNSVRDVMFAPAGTQCMPALTSPNSL